MSSNVTNSTCSDTGAILGDIIPESLIKTLLLSFPFLGMLMGDGSSGALGTNLFIGGFLLLIANNALPYLSYYWWWLWSSIQGRLFFSLVIKSEDEIFQWLMEFMHASSLSKRASSISAHSSWGVKSGNPWQPQTNPFADSQSEKRPKMYFMPYYGNWFFIYKGWPIFINRFRDRMDRHPTYEHRMNQAEVQIQKEFIRLSTFGFLPRRTIEYLKGILRDCMEVSYKKHENKTWIYTPTIGYQMVWKRTMAKSVRTFDSVVLDGTIKDDIKTDLEMFLDSKEWYQQRGIPYRRGYLLHGPPGTGKSSYITALAGKLKMSIAVLSLSLSSMDDQKISKLIDDSPRNSILVIEDVDVALIKEKKHDPKNPMNRGIITLSGLLNALDGIATAEGRVLFMTTNYPEKLASALTRPGRVDVKARFGFASPSQVRGLWFNFYVYGQEDEKKRELMKDIGEELSKQIPEDSVTCAELQGFFLLHRFKEETILEGVEKFLEEVKLNRMKEKEEKEEAKKRELEDKKEEMEEGAREMLKKMKQLTDFKSLEGLNSPDADTTQAPDFPKKKEEEEKEGEEGGEEEIIGEEEKKVDE